jgi:2-polyprenyl-3-methyl-5-hydroxy-6-metoxy-1,4-benzoquinol methylase
MPHGLTARQERERDFYETFSSRNPVLEATFDPVLGLELRPWNSYWRLYQIVREHFHSPSQRLLDFGCGSGTQSIRYAKIGYQVVGFDISTKNIEGCKALAYKYHLSGNTQFDVQAAEELSYADESFDVIAGVDILHHLEIEPSIGQVHRLLKPGGIAVFREHIEVPVIDALRNTSLVRRFFPNDASYNKNITQDERKLSAHDIKFIQSIFPRHVLLRFGLISRMHYFFPAAPGKASRVEKMDHALMNIFPFLQRLGGSIILILRK